jgi:hypothetical protein
MTSLKRSVAALALLTLPLAACGGGDDDSKKGGDTKSSGGSSSSAPGVEPATGTTLKTDDFSYKAPEGWEDAKALMPTAESAAANKKDTDGFADNLNVLRLDPAPIKDPADLEKASVDELEGAKVADVTVHDRQEVDGSTGIHVSGGMDLNGNKYLVEQFNIVHDDVAYVVTFSFSPDVPKDERDELSQSVLATWKWA